MLRCISNRQPVCKLRYARARGNQSATSNAYEQLLGCFAGIIKGILIINCIFTEYSAINKIYKSLDIIPAKHPNNCLYAFEVADWLPLARAYLSLQTGCLLLMRLNISVSVFVSVYVSVYASAYDLYLYLYL